MPTSARHATRQRAASDILMQVVVRIGNLALGVVVTALVVRTLGEYGYGQWSTILIVLALIGYFGNFGMEEVAIREAARDPAARARVDRRTDVAAAVAARARRCSSRSARSSCCTAATRC